MRTSVWIIWIKDIMKHYDLIIIGAGNLGTFHAYHALLKSKKVLLIEKDSMPMEATVRNFGQVVPSGQALDEWFNYGRRSLEIYKSIQAKFDITARQNGTYYFASDSNEMMLLEEARTLFKYRNYPVQLLSKKACLEKIPSLKSTYAAGGLFFSEEISVEPRTMVHRVREMLIHDFPLDYCPNTTVRHCELKDGLVLVQTADNQTFQSDKVAVCNGRDFKFLFPEIFMDSGMKISKLNMMSTYPLTGIELKGNILSGLSIRRYDSFKSCPSYPYVVPPIWQKEYAEYGIHILFKQALDGSIIIGDSHEYAPVNASADLDFGIEMHINELILKEARRMIHLPDWRIQNYWAGYYAQSANGGIFEHTIDDKIFISTGIGGKGMTTAAGYSEDRISTIFQ